jgi:hypothetical protein
MAYYTHLNNQVYEGLSQAPSQLWEAWESGEEEEM